MEETTIITVRKSALTAEGEYDYQKLTYPRNGFLNCDLKEDKEEVHFTYQIGKCNPFTQIRQEKMEVRLAILMDVPKLFQDGKGFQFSINPENIFYDFHHRVYVMEKDVHERGKTFDEHAFINEFKALVGYCLQAKYTFEDYKEGGEALLKKHSILKPLYGTTSIGEIVVILEKQYEDLKRVESKKVVVSRGWYQKSRNYLILLMVGLIGSCSYIGYQLIYMNPYQNAVITAGDAFLDSDYIGTIDALQKVSLDRMALAQKYILASSYIKSENLTEEQKNNILAGISLRSSEKLLEYWIYLGRLDVSEAQNIAMQFSDDQLLLYAYLKEKQLIETNTLITGEEKISALTTIEAKIKPLAEKFAVEEEID